jgi:hypothetical protein
VEPELDFVFGGPGGSDETRRIGNVRKGNANKKCKGIRSGEQRARRARTTKNPKEGIETEKRTKGKEKAKPKVSFKWILDDSAERKHVHVA